VFFAELSFTGYLAGFVSLRQNPAVARHHKTNEQLGFLQALGCVASSFRDYKPLSYLSSPNPKRNAVNSIDVRVLSDRKEHIGKEAISTNFILAFTCFEVTPEALLLHLPYRKLDRLSLKFCSRRAGMVQFFVLKPDGFSMLYCMVKSTIPPFVVDA